MMRKSIDLRAIFAIPLALGLCSLIGLVGALVGDGAWNVIGSMLLATSVVAVAWARLRRRR